MNKKGIILWNQRTSYLPEGNTGLHMSEMVHVGEGIW